MSSSGSPPDTGGSAVETELNRDIGIVGAIAIGVGTMIAAGIFVLSGLAVNNVGAAAIVAFLAAAIVASFTAFAYAEFASIYPESGGGYMYVANVFDTDLTYIVGWSMILGYPASAAFYVASFADWFHRFIYPLFDIPSALPFWISGVVVLGLLVAVNLKGTEETGMFQIAVTALKIALIVLFLYGGLQAFRADVVLDSLAQNTQGFADLRNIGLTSALVFITFFGFEAIATNAEEIKSPGETVPKAIFISMGLVTVIYTLVVLVIVLAVHDEQFLQLLVQQTDVTTLDGAREFIATNGEVAMGYAAQYYLGDIGFYVIIAGALLSMVSAANATILAGSRVKLAMARRDHLPRQFNDLHDRFNTPYKSVLLTGGFILLYIMAFTVLLGGHAPSLFGVEFHFGIESLTHFADFMLLFGLVVVNLAIIRSRRKNPDIDRGFEVPFVPWVPIIAVLANLVLLVNVELSSFLLGVAAEIVGVAFYVLVLSGKSDERVEEETPTVIADREPSERDYRVLVSIANPENVEQLMRTAIDIAQDRNGEVLVMSAVKLPAQTPLSKGRQYADAQKETIDQAMEFAADEDVPVSGTVRIGHDVSEAILNTVEQYECDAALLGWSNTSRRRDIVLGSNVDVVAREAKCDVYVEKTGEEREDIETILLPTAGGPHAELAAETAEAIAHSEDADVRLVTVVSPDASDQEVTDAEHLLAETAESFFDFPVEQEVLEGDDVADTLVEEANDHDLTLIGTTREGLLQELVFGAIPEEVGRRAETTVIMTKKNLGITSRIQELFRRE
ncbi:amino acid permease [Salarchaeum japonicum]|uniref:amino acid permease n=1 Tax=Salarchaeum japonicum TaxID=555573 RepID=UPI003C7713B3